MIDLKGQTRLALLLVTISLSLPQGMLVLSQEEGPLFLSPLIASGRLEEARNLSLVRNFFPGVRSYSGFITVNETINSNLFFWFFPAETNSSEAPVLLWNEGGPAVTGFHSVFNLNGPFGVEETDGKRRVARRQHSWHLTQNIIYLDSPGGVGYSFSDQETVDSPTVAAIGVYELLTQFLSLFPDLKGNDLYVGGASYGATYSVALGALMDSKEPQPFNLKGLILESPWINPYAQADYGTYLRNVGLITEETKNDFDEKRDRIRGFLDGENYVDAMAIWGKLIGVDVTAACGFLPLYNIYKGEFSNFDHTDIVTTPEARTSFHVGNSNFSWVSLSVQSHMNKNFMRAVSPLLETLLDKGYRVIVFVGNLDVITGHLGVENMVNQLQWTGQELLRNATRKIWRVGGNNEVAGYARRAKGLSYVIVRNAGHGVTGDQAKWSSDLLHRFINDMDF